jgi:hypothetical protein
MRDRLGEKKVEILFAFFMLGACMSSCSEGKQEPGMTTREVDAKAPAQPQASENSTSDDVSDTEATAAPSEAMLDGATAEETTTDTAAPETDPDTDGEGGPTELPSPSAPGEDPCTQVPSTDGCASAGPAQSTGQSDPSAASIPSATESAPDQPPAPSTGQGEPLTSEEFCSGRAHLDDAWCEYQDTCCTAEDVASDVFYLPGCLAQDLVEENCNAEIAEALADGLTFDGTWAAACLQEVAPWEHAVPSGGCVGTWYDEAYVSKHNPPSLWALDSCQRMLTANVGEGEPCNNVRACAPGLGCGPSTSADGEEFLCHTRGGTGEPCYSANECEVGLICYPFDNGSCQPPSPTNGPCEGNDDCEDGNMCHLDYCGPRLGLGDSCPNYTFCLMELDCDFSNAICSGLLSAGEGPCESDYDCEGRCDFTTSTCANICGGTR